MIDADLLAQLPPDTILTVQVRVSDLQAALENLSGGPEWLSPKQASERHGRSPAYWRKKAAEWQDQGHARKDGIKEGSPWLLRSDACGRHLAGVALDGSTPTTPRKRGSVRHGPRKRQAT